MKTESPEFDAKEPAVLIGVAAVLVGLGLAAWGAWTCDDAFISYRYAKNLVHGNGLVYNVGERVEGYTNLLWTLWIAVGLLVHVDPDTWSTIWGLFSYAAVLVLLLAFHLELRRNLPVARFTLPVACLVAALHPDFNVFATSGLETSAFTAVSFAGYFVLAAGLVSGQVRPVVTGVIFGIASMLRPDGMVFAAVAGAALLAFRHNRVKNVAYYVAAVGLFWGGTTAFRLAYYGDYFPNTYYAKSANVAWHSQGFAYLGKYLQKYWALYLAAITVGGWRVWSLWTRRGRADQQNGLWDWFGTHAALAAAFVVTYTYYVVRVGGDFMFARLLIPVTPYLAMLLELALYRLSLLRPIAYGELAFASIAFPLFTPRPVSGTEWDDGIADERAVYNDTRVAEDDEKAKALGAFFRGLPVRIAFLGTEARIMYEADIPVAIESDTGLTDRAIAHQTLTKRGRIGHEKRASALYLIAHRKVHFMIAPTAPEVVGLGDYIPLRTVQLGPVKTWILYWDPPLMDELRRRGALFTDFGDYLDRYVATMGARPTPEVAKDYAKFRRFYFDHVADPAREAPFESRLNGP